MDVYISLTALNMKRYVGFICIEEKRQWLFRICS